METISPNFDMDAWDPIISEQDMQTTSNKSIFNMLKYQILFEIFDIETLRILKQPIGNFTMISFL